MLRRSFTTEELQLNPLKQKLLPMQSCIATMPHTNQTKHVPISVQHEKTSSQKDDCHLISADFDDAHFSFPNYTK